MRFMGAVLLAVILTACGSNGGQDSTNHKQPLKAAHDTCVKRFDELVADEDTGQLSAESSDYFDLGSDAKSLSTGAPEGGDLQDIYAFFATACVLGELNAPSGVGKLMEGTNSLMGRQTEDWGDYQVTWSYHPDTSLSAVFEDVS